MKLPKNLEDVEFEYVSGLTMDDGAERIYVNKELGLQVNLCTPKDKFGVWGKGVRTFSLIGSKDFYDTYDELLEAEKG